MRVSVIVPVYNVEECLDRCVESILKQTFTDFEILLIDDGSTDSSYKICCNYAEKYDNVRVFHKKNEGLGCARNYGVQHSEAKYIMYVDSDDWVDATIIEKLYSKIQLYDAQIAVCDRYNYLSSKNTYEYVKNNLKQEIVYSSLEKETIFDISTVAWAKLYKKSLLTKNNIRQPSCKFEDVITPVTLALAEKICYVQEPLYYYWIDRKKSITNDYNYMEDIDYLHVLINEFKQRNLYEEFQTQIEKIIKYRISWNMQRASSLIALQKDELDLQYSNYKSMNREFLEEQNIYMPLDNLEGLDNVCVFGSYNLMIAAKIITGITGDANLKKHFSFSNIISMMSKPAEKILNVKLIGKNEYRKQNVMNDLSKTFRNMNAFFIEQCDTILIDFLEDRFKVCEYENTYYTVSDALEDCTETFQKEGVCIGMGDENYWSLWYDKCDLFIQLLKTRYSDKKIILVKSKLTEQCGSYQKREAFADLKSIQFINMSLEKEYAYFIEKFEELIVIDIENCDYFYTDKLFRHGCVPWHLNAEMYKIIAEKIREALNDGK